MRRFLFALSLLVVVAAPAHAQLDNFISLKRLNRELGGQIVDYTHNHWRDHRIDSPLLGMPRDLYVYLPPGYNPRLAYPLIVYLHGAFGDEHAFIDDDRIKSLDQMILAGCYPPVIVACPDGTYHGRDRNLSPHSLFVNGRGGAFEDHLRSEVLPFLSRHYSIRPERGAHALFAISAGGIGAMNLALKHPELFGSVALLSPPINMRYTTCHGDPLEPFRPETYRWKDYYDPNEAGGVLAGGLIRLPVKLLYGPVFGNDDETFGRIVRANPADLLFSRDHPLPLALFIHYGGRDPYNIDGQSESFAWLASQRGLAVELEAEPGARHSVYYFRRNHVRAWLWLRGHLLPPVEVADPPQETAR